MNFQDNDPPFRMPPPADVDDRPLADSRSIDGPATALIIAASLAMLLNCAGTLALNAFTSSSKNTPRPPGMSDDEYYNHKLGKDSAPFLQACAIAVPTLAIYPLALFGAIRMKMHRNYGLALTSAILLMLPCSVLFPVSLPLGIWALVRLTKPEVKSTFA